jgi:hypothetical protein
MCGKATFSNAIFIVCRLTQAQYCQVAEILAKKHKMDNKKWLLEEFKAKFYQK